MFDRRQLLARGAAIVLMFASFGYAQADTGDDQADVIEEIVVIGREKWQLPNLGSSSGADPVVKKPGWIDWRFLPIYDPEQAYPYVDQFQLDEETRRAGFVVLFRARFGR